MKKLTLSTLLLLSLFSSLHAQNLWQSNGNIGIQTLAPAALLDLGPGNGVKELFYGSGGNPRYYWGTGVNLGQTPNEASIFIGGAADACCGPENFAIVTGNGGDFPYTGYTTRFIVNSRTGNVGIGTLQVNDASYKLFVESGIRTRKVVVDQATWPDFVFHPRYPRPSLEKVEAYIQANHHLPDMPSADSVARNGLNLGDNQARLLQKIEELTLYIIELHKEVEQLKKQIPAGKQP